MPALRKLTHLHDELFTGRQDACATEIDPFAARGYAQFLKARSSLYYQE
ncbi:hypothetical protein [Egbenema bharatensis]